MSDTPSSGSRRRLLWVIVVLVALLAAGWWFFHQRSAASHGAATAASGAQGNWAGRHGGGKGGAGAQGGQPIAVGVAPVTQQNAPMQVSALGTVVSNRTVTVRTQVNGPLLGVYFQEGQTVKKGQLLAEVDARPAQAALMQAQGQLLRDQALLENARHDLSRYRQLLAQDSIASQQVDTQASLVKQYEGTVRLDQGAVNAAKVGMSYTRITAPVAGVVGLRQVDPGNMVSTTDANGIVVINETNPINVTFALPEGGMDRLRKARETVADLRAEAWSRDNTRKLADGVLLAVDNQISTATGTVTLKARFDNANQQLFPNQFVNVRLDLGALPDAIMVPTAAIQMGKVGTFVYLVNADHTVSVNAVTTGETSGLNTIITKGLQPGQTVVVDGLDKLRDGASIQPVDRAAQAAAAAQPASAASGAGHGHGRHASAPGSVEQAASATVPAPGGSGPVGNAVPLAATPAASGAAPMASAAREGGHGRRGGAGASAAVGAASAG